MTAIERNSADAIKYGRFQPRLRAMFIDWMIVIAVAFALFGVLVVIRIDALMRIGGIAIVAFVILYEPLQVAFRGGTIGHRMFNLRVVGEDGGNIGIVRAFVRLIIKQFLGLLSFVLMAATRRNQAVHDLLTRTTVQMGDGTYVDPADFITERTELTGAHMPSRLRRVGVILAYLFLVLAFFVTIEATIGERYISEGCDLRDICTLGESVLMYGLSLAFLACCMACIVLGWRGQLYGARRAAAAGDQA